MQPRQVILNVPVLQCRDHESQTKLETMIGDVIDTFRNTTPAVNQKFVRKV